MKIIHKEGEFRCGNCGRNITIPAPRCPGCGVMLRGYSTTLVPGVAIKDRLKMTASVSAPAFAPVRSADVTKVSPGYYVCGVCGTRLRRTLRACPGCKARFEAFDRLRADMSATTAVKTTVHAMLDEMSRGGHNAADLRVTNVLVTSVRESCLEALREKAERTGTTVTALCRDAIEGVARG